MDNGLTNVEEVRKSKTRHPDRVTLTAEHLEKLDGWIKQVTANHRGVRITRNNVVDWLIGSYPTELPRADEKTLAERYYDEECFLKAAMRELRSRKARGETVNLMELLATVGTAKPGTPARKPRKPKVPAVSVPATNASPELP